MEIGGQHLWDCLLFHLAILLLHALKRLHDRADSYELNCAEELQHGHRSTSHPSYSFASLQVFTFITTGVLPKTTNLSLAL